MEGRGRPPPRRGRRARPAARDSASVPRIADLLFPERTRDDPAPKRAAESTYKFLDRVDDPAFARVRETFNAWFERFADNQDPAEVANVRGRLRAKQPLQFEAAFWELYLHELHVRLGFSIQAHPPGPRKTHPDFLVTRGNERFYLEAVMPAPRSAAAPGPPGAETVIEYVAAAYNPDFSLAVRFASGGALPRRKAVVAAVERWLRSLTWSQYRDTKGVRYPLPETELPVGEWVVGLQAIPRSPAKRGDRTFPTVAVYPGSAGFEEAVMAAITPTLDEKASKYGELDAPHVIAAWVMSPLASAVSLATALFGVRLPLQPGRHTLDLPGADNRRGLWTPDRQRRDRPTAVLVAGSWDFSYSAVARVLPRLWHNPWAKTALMVDYPFAASRVAADERAVENTDASADPAALFELPDSWPGVPFAPHEAPTQ